MYCQKTYPQVCSNSTTSIPLSTLTANKPPHTSCVGIGHSPRECAPLYHDDIPTHTGEIAKWVHHEGSHHEQMLLPRSNISLLAMCVCVRERVYMYMYKCIYLCICMYVSIRTYVCISMCRYIMYAHTHIYMCVCVCVCVYICMYMCVYMYVYMYACMHVCLMFCGYLFTKIINIKKTTQ